MVFGSETARRLPLAGDFETAAERAWVARFPWPPSPAFGADLSEAGGGGWLGFAITLAACFRGEDAFLVDFVTIVVFTNSEIT